MATKTTHIIPKDDGWVVRKEPTHLLIEKKNQKWVVNKPRVARANEVYSTQREAVEAARRITRRAPAGQIVVHERNGSIRAQDIHGLPIIQNSPKKSDLGTKAIERAVSTVIRERLERA